VREKGDERSPFTMRADFPERGDLHMMEAVEGNGGGGSVGHLEIGVIAKD